MADRWSRGIGRGLSAQLCRSIVFLTTIHPCGVGSVTLSREPDEVGQPLSQGLTTGSRAAAAVADDDSLITHSRTKITTRTLKKMTGGKEAEVASRTEE